MLNGAVGAPLHGFGGGFVWCASLTAPNTVRGAWLDDAPQARSRGTGQAARDNEFAETAFLTYGY